MILSKRMLPALLASALPFAAQAMEGHGQGGQGQWSQQQQCAPCVEIVKPPVAECFASCLQTKNIVTYELSNATKILKKRWRTVDCQLTQHNADGNCGENCYQVDKVCPPTDQDQSACQSNQNNQGQGGSGGDQFQCYPLATQPIHSDWKVVATGTKTGYVKYLNYTEEELSLRGGDSCIHHNACQPVCAEEFLADLTDGIARCLTLDDAKFAVGKVLAELSSGGKLTYVDGKRTTELQGGQTGHGGTSGQGSQIMTPVSKGGKAPVRKGK